MNKSANLLAGVDSIQLDTRRLNITEEEITEICRAFRLGELQTYEPEKDIAVSHSNHFICLTTTSGKYALKFYPPKEAKNITTELLLNRSIVKQGFPTPLMHFTSSRSAFLQLDHHLATCFDLLEGQPAYRHKLDRKKIRRINTTISQLKKILSRSDLPRGLRQAETFLQKIKTLLAETKQLAPAANLKLIDQALSHSQAIFSGDRDLFIQRPLHNNLSLANLFWHKNKFFLLDLSHIQIDCALSDLASLVMSCQFMDQSNATIKAIIKSYFSPHPLAENRLLALTACLQIGLVKEYLKTERRHQNLALATAASPLDRLYLLQLRRRKKTIANILRTLQSKTKPPFYP